MPGNIKKCHEGLCSTCNNAPDCSLCDDMSRAIWECEEYEDSIPPPRKDVRNAFVNGRTAVLAGARGAQAPEKYKGLCLDCENRTTCSYGNREAGVWHCEDYR